MNCLRTNKPVTHVAVGAETADCFLCEDCVNNMHPDAKSKANLKTWEELFPDQAEREAAIKEFSAEVENYRNEIKNQKETVKDCHDTFCEEMMKQCHQNLLDNNIHNILEAYNERFQQARSDWEDEKSLKNLRKLAESYALLLKIEDLQAKREKGENSDKLVLDGIVAEMERLKNVCDTEIKELHGKHLEDIKDYIANNFEAYIKEPVEDN